MSRILIAGSYCYIGSLLKFELAKNNIVRQCDLSMGDNYANLSSEYLNEQDVIIVLAGHSSVPQCNGPLVSPWLNNVTNFNNLVKKVKNKTIIYASSASVYGNSLPGVAHIESSLNFVPHNNYDLTKYHLDIDAELARYKTNNTIIGLRFGTVNGWSPVLRTDVMINSMYHTAITKQEIHVTNAQVYRAILGIDDLCNAVCNIVKNPIAGNYNLASFNDTVGNIANAVGKQLSIPVIDKGTDNNAYNFALNCDKFCNTYDFKFKETPDRIVTKLKERYEYSTLVRRDTYFEYNRD